MNTDAVAGALFQRKLAQQLSQQDLPQDAVARTRTVADTVQALANDAAVSPAYAFAVTRMLAHAPEEAVAQWIQLKLADPPDGDQVRALGAGLSEAVTNAPKLDDSLLGIATSDRMSLNGKALMFALAGMKGVEEGPLHDAVRAMARSLVLTGGETKGDAAALGERLLPLIYRQDPEGQTTGAISEIRDELSSVAQARSARKAELEKAAVKDPSVLQTPEYADLSKELADIAAQMQPMDTFLAATGRPDPLAGLSAAQREIWDAPLPPTAGATKLSPGAMVQGDGTTRRGVQFTDANGVGRLGVFHIEQGEDQQPRLSARLMGHAPDGPIREAFAQYAEAFAQRLGVPLTTR